MRLSTYLASAAVLFAFGVVGFRIIDLEQRVALLSSRNEHLETETAHAEQQLKEVANPPIPTKNYDARLRAIEESISALENMKGALPMPTGNMGDDRLKQ